MKAEFRWFSGLGVRAADEVLAHLDLLPIASDSARLILRGDLDRFHDYRTPTEETPRFVSSLDTLFLARRDFISYLRPEDREHPLVGEVAGGLSDLAYNAIIDRGRLIGLWEYDPSEGDLVCMTFASHQCP